MADIKLPPLPDAAIYYCEWERDQQAVYFGEPGSAIEDDWLKAPTVKNDPYYSAEQMRERDNAVLEAAAQEMERRNEQNANTPETKAAYENAAAAIRSLKHQEK